MTLYEQIMSQNIRRLLEATEKDKQSFMVRLSTMRRTECASFMLMAIRVGNRTMPDGVIKTVRRMLNDDIKSKSEELALRLDVYTAILDDMAGALELAAYVLRWYDKNFHLLLEEE